MEGVLSRCRTYGACIVGDVFVLSRCRTYGAGLGGNLMVIRWEEEDWVGGKFGWQGSNSKVIRWEKEDCAGGNSVGREVI